MSDALSTEKGTDNLIQILSIYLLKHITDFYKNIFQFKKEKKMFPISCHLSRNIRAKSFGVKSFFSHISLIESIFESIMVKIRQLNN